MTDTTTAEAPSEATEAASTDKKDVVPSQYREKYKATGGTCGDFIATELQKIAKDGTDSLNTVKAENGIDADRWAGFNPGMQRMNLANVLRGTYLKGGTIKILGKEFNAKHQAEDANFTIEETPASMQKMAGFLGLQDNERTVTALTKLFFPAKTGKTAEEREAEKAAKAKAKEDEKASKKAEADLKKATAARDKAKTAFDKVNTEFEAAQAAATAADEAATTADEEGRPAAEKALTAANAKVTKVQPKFDAAKAKLDEAQAALDALAPATTEAE